MSTHITGDLSVWSVGGGSLLATVASVSAEFTEKQVDGSSIARLGKSNQGTKISGAISTSVMSTIAAPDRVSHLDLTSASLNGNPYLGDLASLTFKGTMENKMRAGVGAMFERPVVTKKDYSASVELDATLATTSQIAVAMLSANYSARDVALALVLNGVAVSLPMRMSKLVHKFERDDLQRLALDLTGKDPGTGAYPTAPTASGSLLERALNDPTSPLAFTLTSHATEGVRYEGSMVFTDFSFAVKDGELVTTDYSWMTTGTVTAVSMD